MTDLAAGPVQRWRDRLAARVGMTEAEIGRYVAALEAFCAAHDVVPELLLKTWEDYPQLAVRRRPTGRPPELAVESFLIHNGVNVFGDIVCVAGRPEDLAAQGPQFIPR